MLPDDPDAQARLFYLVLLGAVLVVGLFGHYRRRLGQAAQHAAIWALIFVAAVLAVGFYEPLKRQIFPDAGVRIDASTVAFDRARDGHFYATLEVNGTDVEFLIDTGATNMVLTLDDAERAGINPAGLAFLVPTETANGRVMSAPVRLESVRLGEIEDRHVRATVSGGELRRSLIGMSYLGLFRGFRVEGDRFYLTR